MFGYTSKIVYVDLTKRRIRFEVLKEGFLRKYVGGIGFGTYLLYHGTEPNVDPFGPENVLVFAAGPFTGTVVPSCGRYVVEAKSPLTNILGVTLSSGPWGPRLKYAGYDALIILGKSDKPVYLFIDDDSVDFIDASALWGKDTWETDDLIREEIEDENVAIAAIGPAGEKLVRFAAITNDRNRQAGRTGMGAVMGSKNLKAIAVRGTKEIAVAKLDDLMEICRNFYRGSFRGESVKRFIKYGTAQSVSTLNYLGVEPVRNWLESSSELAENVCGEYIREHYDPKVTACWGCPTGCDQITSIEEGPFKGTVASVEYETIYALGLNCGVGHFPAIVKATELCDRLGLDTISAGVTIAWAMECYEKGILKKKQVDDLDLRFGNYEAEIQILRKMALREGIGDLLAEGVKRASEKVGKGSEHFAMHNKGLELPGFDIRGLKACGLGFNTSPRGGCHMRSSAYVLDLGGRVDRFKADPKLGKMVMDQEDFCVIRDALILCSTTRYAFDASLAAPGFSNESMNQAFAYVSNLYSLVTGISLAKDELWKAGERISNLQKLYNLREGWKRQDDYPPPRIMEDPISNGTSKGSVLTKEEFELMHQAYFDARGWSVEGIPRRQKLAELGLIHVMEDMKEDE